MGEAADQRVAQDILDGQRANVVSTPTLFIDGIPVMGAEPEVLDSIISSEVEEKDRLGAPTVAQAELSTTGSQQAKAGMVNGDLLHSRFVLTLLSTKRIDASSPSGGKLLLQSSFKSFSCC